MLSNIPPPSVRRLSLHRLDRSSNRDTIIENSPQVERESRKEPKYDDLYEITDDETDEIPIRISSSLSNGEPTPKLHKRFPSLVIPSPSAWPKHQGYRKPSLDMPLPSSDGPSPAILVTPASRAVSRLTSSSVGSSSTAPSLDGSITSEELSSFSCPSTPELEEKGLIRDWTSPLQLDPKSMQTLSSITGNHGGVSPILFVAEMKEVDERKPHLGVDVLITPIEFPDQAELSALSVPSPGGFFATLEPSTRRTWSIPTEEIPSTGTAERFYGVPWANHDGDDEQILEYYFDDDKTEGPPTARRIALISPRSVDTLTDNAPPARQIPVGSPRGNSIQPLLSPRLDSAEYKDNYKEELKVIGQSNLDRTSLWLREQETYLSGGKVSTNPSSTASPRKKQLIVSPIQEVEEPAEEPPPPPQSVRLAADGLKKIVQAEQALGSAHSFKTSDLVIRATEEIAQTTKSSDAFVQRKVRTDKLRLDRRCLFSTHLQNLDCNFHIQQEEPKNRRPTSDIFGPESCAESQALDAKLKQRRALEAIKPVSWNLEATKLLNGGSLLTSPTGKLMPKFENGAVLDLGGTTSTDWAWEVASTHPHTTVTTVCTETDHHPSPSLLGPSNHKFQKVPNLWTLPFRNDSFHLISARNLMSLLRTDRPPGRSSDEYDLCLRECMRVLKPGGYLEFALLDAEILSSSPLATALSVEFASDLRSRGYDPQPTRPWLPRLRRAGFAQVRRAWVTLPLAMHGNLRGPTADASHISGLVGSWAWERWLIRLRREMGWDEGSLLDDVSGALEEGGREGACWRYLSGWARKEI